LGVVEFERGIDLAASLDGLLVELVSAALGAVEIGLELVAGMEKQVDRANGVGIGGELFAVSERLEMDNSGTRGEDALVHHVGKGLILRETETGPGGG
jgi:hypothetical protein